MEHIWLKHYPKGVPATIDNIQYTSIVQLLEEAFQTYSARAAFTCMGEALTYADLKADRKRLLNLKSPRYLGEFLTESAGSSHQ